MTHIYDAQHHERDYRGQAVQDAFSQRLYTVCGVGAVGSAMVDMLARMGARYIHVIDRDRVSEGNIGTQLYSWSDIGAAKVNALATLILRATKVRLQLSPVFLDATNVHKLLKATEIVIDAFDNGESRGVVARFCATNALPCLHVGLNGGYAEVHWNEGYRVPAVVEGPGACAYPLSRTLVSIAASLAVEELMRYAAQLPRRNSELTLGDLTISTQVA